VRPYYANVQFVLGGRKDDSCGNGRFVKKKPNPGERFKWMIEWENVSISPEDEGAYKLYLSGSDEHCNLVRVNQLASPVKLLAFLRYDCKKVLIRARYLYIDRLRDGNKKIIKSTDLDCAFFEPILLCFSNLEFIGRILFSDEINWSPTKPKTKDILAKVLKQMGSGYETYANLLISFHRYALSHELRPEGIWTYDLNTEDLYGAPRELGRDRIYLNIPHFIDSCILELENLCDQLINTNSQQKIMNKFSCYIGKRFSAMC
jgi:hypothetical protein